MNRFFHIAGIVWFATALLLEWTGWNQVLTALSGAVLAAVVIFIEKPPLWLYATAAAFCGCVCFPAGLRPGPALPRTGLRGAHGGTLCAGNRPATLPEQPAL